MTFFCRQSKSFVNRTKIIFKISILQLFYVNKSMQNAGNTIKFKGNKVKQTWAATNSRELKEKQNTWL